MALPLSRCAQTNTAEYLSAYFGGLAVVDFVDVLDHPVNAILRRARAPSWPYRSYIYLRLATVAHANEITLRVS